MNGKEFGSFEFLQMKLKKAWWGGNNSVILQDWFPKRNQIPSLQFVDISEN